ncbi:MAG: 3-oxoacyl-ACP reductase FabG [Bacteroidales bacterium]|jgi:3-oxoacyl-[acyl-carrier protein] reductase
MNRIALITGGSRGIGKAIALQLASEGYHVLINYHSNHAAAENTLLEVNDKGGHGELLQFDVSDREETIRVVNAWKDNNKDKNIEILINNAGIRKDNLLIWLEPDQWTDVINTNLNSFYFLTRHLLQDMLLNKFGRIINIVSLSGQKGMSGQVNYSAAKGGIIAATKALAQEVGKKKVTVNAVAPGFIETDMTADLDEQTLKKLIPLNRFGKPQEVADLVSFLASEKAGYITGEVISINGGLYT